MSRKRPSRQEGGAGAGAGAGAVVAPREPVDKPAPTRNASALARAAEAFTQSLASERMNKPATPAPTILPRKEEKAAMMIMRKADVEKRNIEASYVKSAKPLMERMDSIRKEIENHMGIHRKQCLRVNIAEGDEEVVWATRRCEYLKIDMDLIKANVKWLLDSHLKPGVPTVGLDKHKRTRVSHTAKPDGGNPSSRAGQTKVQRMKAAEWAEHYAKCVMVRVSNIRKREGEGGVNLSRLKPPPHIQDAAMNITPSHPIARSVAEYMTLVDKVAKLRERKKKWMDTIAERKAPVESKLMEFLERTQQPSYEHFKEDEDEITDVKVDIRTPMTEKGEETIDRFEKSGVKIYKFTPKPKKPQIVVKDYTQAMASVWHTMLDTTKAKKREFTEREFFEMGVFSSVDDDGIEEFTKEVAQEISEILERKISEAPPRPPEVRIKLNKLGRGEKDQDEEEEEEEEEEGGGQQE